MVIGIVCEFDPLHRGHARLLSHARALGADTVVCAMSGSFTERGSFAALSKTARAEMAVRCGADLVLELPILPGQSFCGTAARWYNYENAPPAHPPHKPQSILLPPPLPHRSYLH